MINGTLLSAKTIFETLILSRMDTMRAVRQEMNFDVHLLAVKIDVVSFEVACLKGAKAAVVDNREQRDGTLLIATSKIFFGLCKARRVFTVWQRAMPAPTCSKIHRINEVTNNRQQLLVEGFSFYAVAEISTTKNI